MAVDDSWKKKWTPDKMATTEEEGGPVPTTADEYLEAVANRRGRWIDATCLEWIATTMKVNLMVFKREDQKKLAHFDHAGRATRKNTVAVFFHEKDKRQALHVLA